MDEAVLGGRTTRGRDRGRAEKARRPWALLVLLVALVAPLLPGAPSSPAQAAVTEPVVEQLPDNISPQFINNAGVVAGTSFVGCCLQGAAATWDGGDVVRRPMTGTLVRLVGFNDAGLIAGTTSSGHAVWSASGPTFLAMPNLGPSRGVPIIYGPNTAGGVVGSISWRPGEANGVRWATPTSSPQLLSTISTLMGMAPNGDAFGIAPGGVIGQPTFIRETPAGATSNVDGFPNADILDISSAGHILGSYWSGGAELVWHDGTVTNVPAALHGRAVNADGVVAGTVFTPEGNRAAILADVGEVAYLDDLAPTPQGIRFQQIYDINNSCAMAVQGRVMEDGVDRVRYYRVQLPDCSNNLAVEITERPDESVEVGAEFLIEATIRNESTSDTLTNLTLVDGGVAASEGVEVVAGPLWTPVASLAPGASATVGWLLKSANVGVQQVEVQASGSVGGTTVSRTAGTPVTVIPPVDIVVDSGQTVDTAPGEEFEVNVTVRNEWDKPLADIKPEAIEGPNAGSITKVAGPLGPDGEDATLGGYDLNPEESVRFTYTLRLEEDVWPAIITARFTGRDPDTDTIFFVSGSSAPPDGIGVEIVAEREGSKLTVTTTVSNETGGPVEELGTSGIVDEPVSDGEGGVVPSPLTNPRTDHPLPDTLAAGEEVEIVTELDIVGLGLAVLSESIAGLAGAEPVGGFDIVSIEVGEGEVTVLDAEQAAADGLQTALGTLGETNQSIIEAFTEEVSEVTDTRVVDPGVQRMIDDYKSLGFSDYWAEQLTVWDYERTTFDERAAAGWVEFKAQLNRRGAVGVGLGRQLPRHRHEPHQDLRVRERGLPERHHQPGLPRRRHRDGGPRAPRRRHPGQRRAGREVRSGPLVRLGGPAGAAGDRAGRLPRRSHRHRPHWRGARRGLRRQRRGRRRHRHDRRAGHGRHLQALRPGRASARGRGPRRRHEPRTAGARRRTGHGLARSAVGHDLQDGPSRAGAARLAQRAAPRHDPGARRALQLAHWDAPRRRRVLPGPGEGHGGQVRLQVHRLVPHGRSRVDRHPQRPGQGGVEHLQGGRRPRRGHRRAVDPPGSGLRVRARRDVERCAGRDAGDQPRVRQAVHGALHHPEEQLGGVPGRHQQDEQDPRRIAAPRRERRHPHHQRPSRCRCPRRHLPRAARRRDLHRVEGAHPQRGGGAEDRSSKVIPASPRSTT